MPPLSTRNRRLGLEALETRTLLAGGSDPFGLMADLALTQAAVSGTDYTANFSTNFGNHQLVLSGNSSSVVTIDLDKLPDFITNVRISSFATVTFTGTDKVENLILTDVGTVNAAHLTVTESVHTANVGTLTIGSIVSRAVLSGDSTTLNVASLQSDTLIISDLHTLTLGSDSKSLYVLSLNDTQTVNLTYKPDVVAVTGLPTSSVHVVLPTTIPTPTPGSGGTGSGGVVLPPIVIPDPVDNSHVGTTPGDSAPVGGGSVGSDPVPSVPDLHPTTPVTENPSDHVVIISLPADERTRTFIAELRDLLHASGGDSHQMVLDLVNHSAPNATLNGLISAKSSATNSVPSTMRVEVDGHLVELEGTLEHALSQPAALDLSVTNTESALDPATFVDRPLNLSPFSHSPAQTVSAPNVEVSFAATVAPATTANVVTEPTRARSVSPQEHHDNNKAELGASVMALGTYLVDRVSAEFSPGQQSIVLLVDPKASRTANKNSRMSAIDLFAQGGSVLAADDFVQR